MPRSLPHGSFTWRWIAGIAFCSLLPLTCPAQQLSAPRNDEAAGSLLPARTKTPYAPAKQKPEPPEDRPITKQLLSAALPIDLPTTLRLVNENSPAIGLARARLAEAEARLAQTQVLAVPDLIGGVSYYRLDGNTQNQRGNVFSISRSNLYGFAGPRLRFALADAIFLPLVANRLTDAASSTVANTVNVSEYDAASAYLDLLSLHAALAINRDTLTRAEQVLRYAQAAEEAGLAKTPADVDRARTEVSLLRKERLDLTGQIGIASARLAQLLLLKPGVNLKPADMTIVPLILIPAETSLEELIATATTYHPELAAARQELAAMQTRVRQAKLSPLIPQFEIEYGIGGFGGGVNDQLGQFDTRSVLNATAFWELENLGFGYTARVQTRRAEQLQTQYRLIEAEARIAATVAAAAKQAAAQFEGVDVAQAAVWEALEMYRKRRETSFNMVGPRPQYDAREPLLAIRALNQARRNYLEAVIEFNRAQFRLFTALGQPPISALASATSRPLSLPVVPAETDADR